MQINPYEPPQAPIHGVYGAGLRAGEIASGQRLIIYSILVNLATITLQLAIGPLIGWGGLLALVMSLVGIRRLASGLGLSVPSKVLLFLAMFIPLVNLITLLVINSRATKHLRNAGYHVGLLGASK